jgi:hypothetical protein
MCEEAHLLPVKRAKLLVFEYPDILRLFLANTLAEQLACLTIIRIGTSRVARLRHFRDMDIKLWRKLAALECLELTPKRTPKEAKLRFQAIMQGMNQRVEVQMQEYFDFLRRPTQRRDASLMQCTLISCMTADIFAARRTIHYRLDPSMLHMAMDGLLRSFSCATSSSSPLSCDESNTALPRLTANAVVLQFLFTLVINVGDHYPGLIPRTR